MKPLVQGTDYTLVNGNLIINEGVRHIPAASFAGNNKIKTIFFPSTLISIGKGAFENCCNLCGTLSIPSSVKYIIDKAFDSCKINYLILGENVEYIGAHAFSENSIDIINNKSTKLKLIDSSVFYKNLRPIYNFSINSKYVYTALMAFDNVTIIDIKPECYRKLDLYGDTYNSQEYICDYRNKKSYTFKDGVLKIREGVEVVGNFSDFSEMKECTRVEFPDSVVIILEHAFNDLENIKEVKFPNNLLFIGSYAFSGCSLRKGEITLPKSICALNYNSFSENSGENKIAIYGSSTFYGAGGNNRAKEIFEYIDDNDPEIVKSTSILNIKELMEQDRAKLEELDLLPETIFNNKQIIADISDNQSNAVKAAIVNFAKDIWYYESKTFDNLKSLVSTRMADLSDIHETINILFERNQIKTIYLFMSYGYDYKNNCMISKAIINDMTEMIDVLLILGVDINEIGDIRRTPLSIACQKGDYSLVKYLIEKGAAINMVDSMNKKAIDYAIENNFQDIIDLINSYNNCETEVERDLRTIRMTLNK